MTDDDLIDNEQGEAIGELLCGCVQWLIEDDDPQRFVRRVVTEGPCLLPDMAGGDARGFFSAFAWAVASAAPLPAHGFRPRQLPPPGRNDACLCGSGRPFQLCCAQALQQVPDMPPESLFPLVLDTLPRAQWTTLPGSGATPDMLVAAADAWCDQGRGADAVKLLEPWAQLPAPWPDDRAELLDLLGDLYLDQDKPRKRRQLAEAMVAHGGTLVQSIGWQRLAMMAADKGDTRASQDAFQRAQRLTPDDPRVSMLEVTLLLGAGELDRARERAAFHHRRLARLPQAGQLHGALQMLDGLARGELPPGLDTDVGADDDEPSAAAAADLPTPLARLQQLLDRLPDPALRLDLQRATADDLGPLTPAAVAAKALKAWQAGFPVRGMPQTAAEFDALLDRLLGDERWTALLQRTPRLCDTFEVLDDLLRVLDLLPARAVAQLQSTLLLRGLTLWTQLLQRYPQARCEWAWTENRPALRLLVRRIELDATPRADHSLQWLEAMVNVLNPHDNHGLRQRLAAVYLRRGRAADALALVERYPDDVVGLQLLHERALLVLQRLDEAAATLAAALRANGHVRSLLLSRRKPKEPPVDSFRPGSVEEARITLAGQHDLWAQDKAVAAWLRQQLDAAGASPAPVSRSLFDDEPGAGA